MQKFHRTKYGLAVTAAALTALGLTTGMSTYQSVDVVVDGRSDLVGTYASESVGAFLDQKGIKLTGYDLVEPARTTLLQSGMKIVVKRAKAVVIQDGAQAMVQVHTLVRTVQELLSSLKISLGREDTVSVPLSSPVQNGMRIVITRRKTRVETQTTPLAYQTIRKSSAQYAAGVDVVARPGQDGLKKVVIRKLYRNGKLIAQHTSDRVITEPVDEVLDVGTASSSPVVTSRSDTSLVTSEVLTVVATAYSNPGGYTATGAQAGLGDVAVDPGVIPLGTKLYIPGYGFAVANDTGGAIQGYRIDLCYNSVSQAIDFGRQVVKVYILGKS